MCGTAAPMQPTATAASSVASSLRTPYAHALPPSPLPRPSLAPPSPLPHPFSAATPRVRVRVRVRVVRVCARWQTWDTSGNVRFKPLSLVFYRQVPLSFVCHTRARGLPTSIAWHIIAVICMAHSAAKRACVRLGRPRSRATARATRGGRQAQSVILVFDVKSLASFQALWEVGG